MKMGLKKKDPEEGVPGKRASMKEVPGMDGIFKRMRKAAAVGSTALAIAVLTGACGRRSGTSRSCLHSGRRRKAETEKCPSTHTGR